MRAHRNVLCICAAVGEAEDFVADGEAALGPAVGSVWLGGEGDDGAGELNAHRLGGLRWDRVMALSLEKVHAVEAEGFDFDKSLGAVGNGFWEG